MAAAIAHSLHHEGAVGEPVGASALRHVVPDASLCGVALSLVQLPARHMGDAHDVSHLAASCCVLGCASVTMRMWRDESSTRACRRMRMSHDATSTALKGATLHIAPHLLSCESSSPYLQARMAEARRAPHTSSRASAKTR